MSKGINLDQMELEIRRTLDKYAVLNSEMVREVVEQSAKDTVAELKQTSPSPEHHMYSPKRKYKDGDYAKSWTYDKNQIKKWQMVTLYCCLQQETL